MIKKRFIAGAVCPRCAEMDKIYTYEQDGRMFRACVRCDFEEELKLEAPQQELPTRVSPKEQAPAAEEVQVLKFYPAKSSKQKH